MNVSKSFARLVSMATNTTTATEDEAWSVTSTTMLPPPPPHPPTADTASVNVTSSWSIFYNSATTMASHILTYVSEGSSRSTRMEARISSEVVVTASEIDTYAPTMTSSLIPSSISNESSEQSSTDDVITTWLKMALSPATETTTTTTTLLSMTAVTSQVGTAGAEEDTAAAGMRQLQQGPMQADLALYMPAYAWILALLFGVCCGLALLAAIVSVFKCVRRRNYSRLDTDRINGDLIPAYMRYVYGSALARSGLGSRTDSVMSGEEAPTVSTDPTATADYTFVGVSIPLLQDVTRI